MKGDGEDRGFHDFLSMGSYGSGSSSRSGSGSGSEGFSGRAGADESSSRLLLQSSNLHLLSSLSRNGLSMLAGGSNGSFNLKPPAVGNLAGLRGNSAMRVSKVSGGGFTGFYRASANNKSSSNNNVSTRPSLLPELKNLRVGNDETGDATNALGAAAASQRSHIASKKVVEQPLKADVENLSADECWRLILKLGSRWPAWNHSTTASQAAPQGVVKDRSATKDESVQDLQLGQDSLRFLSSRALEALAQTPDQQGKPDTGGMLAPKWTTQEVAKTNTPTPPTPLKSTQAVSATIAQQQPSLLPEVPVCPSQETTAPKVTSSESRTAPLTIFYAGTVNVCDNVPEDKARLIMLFAEKAGVPPSKAQERADASAEASPLSNPLLERAQPQEELQLSKTSSSEVVLATSCVPSDVEPSAKDAEGSNLDEQTPSEILDPSEMVPLTIIIPEGKSRQRRQHGAAKPLPNARKNSLARFLDTRKRSRLTASCSDGHGQATKRPALSDSLSSDADDVKGRNWNSLARLCSQSSVNSWEGVVSRGYNNDAEMRD